MPKMNQILYVCLSVCLCIFIFIFGFLSFSENLEVRSLCQCILVMRKDRILMGYERGSESEEFQCRNLRVCECVFSFDF